MLVTGLTHHHRIDSAVYWGIFAFSGTFVTYNFHRLVRHKSFEHAQISTERGRWLGRHRTVMIVCSGIFAVAATILFFWLPVQLSSLWVLAAAGMIVMGYALPMPLLGKSLRDISGLKSLWITIVWVLLLYFPLMQYQQPIDYTDLTVIGIFTFVQIIPFDIRDLSYDAPSMKTLPQLIGVRGAQIASTLLIALLIPAILYAHPFHVLLLVAVICSIFGLWWKQTPQRILILEFLWDGALILLGLYYYCLG